ncbi:sensor histidine kinase [Cyclobacteriaceae bacterium YHN15]|nr:sensor histidine kinase [Cyclobacteriaceae bacterium YHN15]
MFCSKPVKTKYICCMRNKNKLYFILMTGSILVLFLVQFFWLSSVYKDYKNSLTQETRLLFATTVTGMLDSLVLKELKPVFVPGIPDTVFMKKHFNKLNYKDTLRSVRIEINREEVKGDSSAEKDRKILVFTAGDEFLGDSIKGIFRPIIQGIDSLKWENRFTFSMDGQSLDAEQIAKKFNEVLASNNYPLRAEVQRFELDQGSGTVPKGAISLEEIRIPFGTRIIGYIESYQGFLLQKMLLPFLFALLVILLISWSMLAMYRNMLKQQRLNLLKNDIISNITHELKTPVSTVAIVLESLENFGANDKAELRKEYIQIAKNELKRLTAMADNILKSSVLEKETKLSFEFLEMDFLLEEKIQSFKPILESQGFIFRYLKEGNDFKLKGDTEQLGLVIFNLLDNAVKYSKDEKNIEISLKEKENKISITIKDKGVGIPEAYQKEIFEKFIRVPQQDLHDVKGYGLGLAQVATIVQAHHGKILLESHVGKGSSFTVQFQKA